MSTRTHKRATEKVGAKAPAGMLALQRELLGRLVSSGGRPSDPAPTLRRLVPVRRQVWRDLQRHAAVLSKIGRPVSPGQLAAMLLEQSVSQLRHPFTRVQVRPEAKEV
jgi:hypothetical protein